MSWKDIEVKGFDEIVTEKDMYPLCVYIGNAVFLKVPIIVALKGLQYFSAYKISSYIVSLAKRNMVRNFYITKLPNLEALFQIPTIDSSIFFFQDESCVPKDILHGHLITWKQLDSNTKYETTWRNASFICTDNQDFICPRMIALNDTVGLQEADLDLLESKCLLALQQELKDSTELLSELPTVKQIWSDIIIPDFDNLVNPFQLYHLCVLIGNAILQQYPTLVAFSGSTSYSMCEIIKRIADLNHVPNVNLNLNMTFSEMFHIVCKNSPICYFELLPPHEILTNSLIHYVDSDVKVKGFWKSPTFFKIMDQEDIPLNVRIIQLTSNVINLEKLDIALIFKKCKLAYEHERQETISSIFRYY
jgi:hypothetical protein